jgi:putative glycosyltransferase (TIGR04372 family)
VLAKPQKLRSLEDFKYLVRWTVLWLKFTLRFLNRFLGDISLGFLVSPVAIPVALVLAARQKTVLVVGLDRLPNISLLISSLEPELRLQKSLRGNLGNLILLDFASKRNSQLVLLYSRKVKTFDESNKMRRVVYWYASRFARCKKVLRESHVWPETSAILEFENHEVQIGLEYLESYGGLEPRKFLCYGLRRESYHQSLISAGANMLLNVSRNPVEDVYAEALSRLNGETFPIVRMGTEVGFPLGNDKRSKVLDYAWDFRNDFMDCFLLANCRFLLNGSSGIFWLASIFDTRVVNADVYDVRVICLKKDLQIIQRLWIEESGRPATLTEMLQYGYYSKDKVQKLKKIHLVKNTVDEIMAVCDEMNARIDGTWVTTEEDEELQRRYQELIVKYSNKPEWNGGGRIGAQFLRENQDLLRE